MSTPWGFAPNPSLTCGAARQAVKTQPPDPVAKCWVGSKASRVKCTASPPLTPLHLRESSKTIEADGAGNLSRLAKQPLADSLYRLEATTLCVRVQEVFPCPCHVANCGCGQRHGVGKTLGGRARGTVCRRHSFRVFGSWVYKAQSQLCVALVVLVIGGRMSPVSLKLPHAPCAPLS